jgi:maltose alpha-D-glucosyltransferase/alpha-amylase
MMMSGSASDPLWYKDAVIYELHVRAFADSNNDGIGDLRGLMGRLDYLQELGVTCLWLLPFFPSPLRDDGYDIADYMNVHPDYGTMDDFKAFLDAAHERGLQVMIELVINHTSDQHAWFKRAREAAPGSPERDYYVWSDSDQKYDQVRIIFTDTEKSNWTWDPVAKAYYWHRFFSHQPDLNFDNPAVVDETLKAMRFWLDLGVDGLRLDATPYLVERDGTNCENLPETHVIIKKFREVMDTEYLNRVILAEANQWPADVRPYFGDGDECHMAFHFPLMPRIFMALRLEDGTPVREVMAQTPDIPASCQWGLFLRNHDELTLEMVSDEERDYMYFAYSADPRMRVNVGIRRRLAPLMDNNRRRIELLHSLLFSFPGTPIIYYGDEIGMGDNIYLGDRNGVRTPMQWSSDRNAGFSRVDPAKLYSPVIMDPIYGYAALNVEAQQSDQSSLLHWMSNLIALRKLFRVFGRGSMEFLETGNPKVLAYLRRDDNTVVLCVANLSRFSQSVRLDLSAFEGFHPVEMLGYVDFPPIDHTPYSLTPGPYAFIWFELQRAVEPDAHLVADQGMLSADEGWAGMLHGQQRERLESEILPRFLMGQRWFGGKARRITTVTVRDWAPMPNASGDAQPGGTAIAALVDVTYANGPAETYFVPLAITFEPTGDVPAQAVLCRVFAGRRTGVLHDAAFHDGARAALLDLVDTGGRWRGERGVVQGVRTTAFAAARGTDATLTSAPPGTEQSNTSFAYGDRLMLKVLRRQQPGTNPEVEIGRYLTDAHFPQIAAVAGVIDYVGHDGDTHTLGLLQAFVPNEGDGWTWTLQELSRVYATEDLTASIDAMTRLGRRTAELHLALGGAAGTATAAGDDAFAPEPLTTAELEHLASAMSTHAEAVLDELKRGLPTLPDPVIASAGAVLGRRREWQTTFARVAKVSAAGVRTRVHGDYHLGQVLRTNGDFTILDFEGEPARTSAERRAKHSPLKDVAGMLRSFSYAAWVGLAQFTGSEPAAMARLAPLASRWESAVSAAFMTAYRETVGHGALVPADSATLTAVLNACLLDKALYEVSYELNNRPAWVWVPLTGVLGHRDPDADA